MPPTGIEPVWGCPRQISALPDCVPNVMKGSLKDLAAESIGALPRT